jgi:hypothetical protein
MSKIKYLQEQAARAERLAKTVMDARPSKASVIRSRLPTANQDAGGASGH